MIAALFVEATGVYSNLAGVDPWPADRDARRYAGPWPVVAHPPCARWCQLAGLVQARYGLRVGEDDGCFAAALEAVRRWGGVLEHPAYSLAWDAFDLPRPSAGGWHRSFFDPGWVTQITQATYGHAARKATWLYYVGPEPPELLDWTQTAGTAVCSTLTNHGGRLVERLRRRERNATPIPFRDLLLSLGRDGARAGGGLGQRKGPLGAGAPAAGLRGDGLDTSLLGDTGMIPDNAQTPTESHPTDIVTCMNCHGDGKSINTLGHLRMCLVCGGKGTGYQHDLFVAAQALAAFRQYTGGSDPHRDIRWSAFRGGYGAGRTDGFNAALTCKAGR